MHPKKLSRSQRVGVVAGALAITFALGVSTIAMGGSFTGHQQTVAATDGTLPHVVVPPEPTATPPNTKAKAVADADLKREEDAAKDKLREGEKKPGDGKKPGEGTSKPGENDKKKPKPNPFPEGYPMVALGDSTMSMAPTTIVKNEASSCTHYQGAWPLRVADRLGMPLADLSCAGAKSSLYWKLQLDKYLGPTTRLVVLSYGSNDLWVVNQLISDNALPMTGPWLPHEEASTVEQGLVDILQDIRLRAPKAMIMTVGYLPLVEGPSCANLPNMTPLEMVRVRRLRDSADEVLTNAARRVSDFSQAMIVDRGLDFLSSGVFNVPFRQVTGHTLCADDAERFILNHEKKGGRYHYTVPGLAFIARAVEDKYFMENPRWETQLRSL